MINYDPQANREEAIRAEIKELTDNGVNALDAAITVGKKYNRSRVTRKDVLESDEVTDKVIAKLRDMMGFPFGFAINRSYIREFASNGNLPKEMFNADATNSFVQKMEKALNTLLPEQ